MRPVTWCASRNGRPSARTSQSARSVAVEIAGARPRRASRSRRGSQVARPCRSSPRAQSDRRRQRVEDAAPCPPACPSNRRAAGPSSRSSSALQRADDAPGLGAHQLGRVGVALLRHDRGAGGEARRRAARSRTAASIQSTISSAKRDRCTAQIAAAASVSSAKSRSETASSELAVGRSKPSASAVMCAVDRERRCRRAPRRRAGTRSAARARRRSAPRSRASIST